MTKEEIRKAHREVLAGILMKNGCHKNTRANTPEPPGFNSVEWLYEVHSALLQGWFIVTDFKIVEWVVTEKGKNFLLEE